MQTLLRWADVLDRIARRVGEWASWIILPLIFIIMFDVFTRKIGFIKEWSAEITINYGFSLSFIFQDLEWHLHGMLLLLTFGFGYLYNAHVRVDIFRENVSRRGQVWIETLGLIICGIPFLLVMIYFSWVMTSASFSQWEGSESQVGLGWRFIIKSFLVTGFTVALFAVLATLLRSLVFLFGSKEERETVEGDLQYLTGADALSKLILEQNKTSGSGKDA